jgi:3-oxoacyl-[acyl-carrier-protein] synthase-3
MNAKIAAISYYLPEGVLGNDELNLLFPEWSADKISSKTGIYQRHISTEGESSGDLAYNAAEKLFAEHDIDKSNIDFILLCTQTPDYFLPTTACVLQNKLGLSTRCGALDFNLGCSGYVYGLSLAKGLIAAGIALNILLLTAETYSKLIHKKDKGNRSLFGDAAAATLVSSDSGTSTIGDFILGTDGSGAENLIVKNGGFRSLNLHGNDVFENDAFVKNDDYLYMNGGEIFNFTNKFVPVMIADLCAKVKMNMDDIDLFVFHQANEFMLNAIRRKLAIPKEKFYVCLKNSGNTVSSTIPIALKEAIDSNTIKEGNKVLIAGFGVGYSWGCTMLQF